MTFRLVRVFVASLAALVLAAAVTVVAHHEILAKFDDKKPVTLSGVVTLVDWRNPHVHVFMDVQRPEESDAQLGDRAGEPDRSAAQRLDRRTRVRPGDSITVEGIAARNGSRQAWGKSVVLTGTGRQVLNVSVVGAACRRSRRGRLRAGPIGSRDSARPASAARKAIGPTRARRRSTENGVNVPMSAYGSAAEHRRCSEGRAAAAVGARAVHRAPAPLPAGRSDVPELQAARRTASVPAVPTASSSWRTASISGFSS